MKRNPAEIHLYLCCSVKKDGDRFVASDDFLDVVTQGESEKAALANFREAAALFAESCFRRGTLYDVLNGPGVPQPAAEESAEEYAVEITVPLVARENPGLGNRTV